MWIKNNDGNDIYRLDPVSDMFENLGSFKDPRNGRRIGAYGIHSDAQNNLYLLDFSAGNLVRIDAQTKNPTAYMTPTPNSRPRRGRVDAEGRLWFAEYQGNAIGVFDPRTEKFSEWKVPTPWSSPYDAAAGRNGEAWTAGMSSDRVLRLDIKTGEVAEYPLPRPTNIRRPYRRCEKPRHAMDRQQPRRIDRQGRTFGLTRAAEPLGGTVLPGSPTDFGKLIADETEKWAKVIRENNIKVE